MSKKDSFIYFLGIGGVSMSSLALMCRDMGKKVMGSDRASSDTVARLKSEGIDVFVGERNHIPDEISPDLVVYTLAIDSENGEYLSFKSRGIPMISRAELLGYIISTYKISIGVSGSHGKSTVTAMIASILSYDGFEPAVLLGADIGNGSGYKKGRDILIYEACEYRDSFLHFAPTLSVILNVDLDHTDYFPNLKAVVDSFIASARLAKGAVICSADDENSAQILKEKGIPQIITFGKSSNASVKYSSINYKDGISYFTVEEGGEKNLFRLPLVGEHAVYDAVAAYSAARRVGASIKACELGILNFRGIARRLQKIGNVGDCSVYYDYAHHPKEIEATYSALKLLGYRKIAVIFAPHTYSRTAALFNGFSEALSNFTKAVIAEIYPAREEPIDGIDAKSLSCAVTASGGKGELLCNIEALEDLTKYECLVLMGAGDLEFVKTRLEKMLDGESDL